MLELLPYIILVVLIMLLIIVFKRNELVVKASSSRYRRIMCLNEEQNFHRIHTQYYRFVNRCNSKKNFEKLDLDQYLMYVIENNERSIASIINKVEENNKKYRTYLSDIKSIKSVVTPRQLQEYKMTHRGYKRIENRVCNSVRLKPVLDINILVVARYESPKKNNVYEKYYEYNYDKIKELYYKVQSIINTKESYEYQKKIERLKMTDSLRYDILRRDNYRCQICGITAKEGAKLHVDHIMPIAKGGKTVPDNLQTLCDRCNLGKSDKY